ncbi:MAG: NTP transferase domain-containing protein, partial [Bacteroidetes bacterium]|nr:NTP transferase domain-containing protein [Bacteroidota bacterium]
MKIAGIILAAGSSSRMRNQNKLMIDINGKTILETVIFTVLKAEINPLIIVLGNDADQFQKTLEDYPVILVKNYEWEKGMSTSIKAGIGALGNDVA